MHPTPLPERVAEVAALAEELAAPRWGRSDSWAAAYGTLARLARLAGVDVPSGGPSKAKAAAIAAAIRQGTADAPAATPAPAVVVPLPVRPAVPRPELDADADAEPLVEERDALRAELADAETDRDRYLGANTKLTEERDHLQEEVEGLRSELEDTRERFKNEQEERDGEAAAATRAELLRDIQEVLETADQRLVEYHGRRLGLELLPFHGRAIA